MSVTGRVYPAQMAVAGYDCSAAAVPWDVQDPRSLTAVTWACYPTHQGRLNSVVVWSHEAAPGCYYCSSIMTSDWWSPRDEDSIH